MRKGKCMAGLLNVGEMGALALHVLVELTVLRDDNPEGRMTVQDIADKLHASVHTLQKVARRLIMLGMIEGTRGANGGLRLIAEPNQVDMLQVVEGIEGRFSSNGCLFAKKVCPADCKCVFDGLTGIMERKAREYFTGTTLADLAEMVRQPVLEK